MEETDAGAVTELAVDNCIIVGDLQQQSPASRLYLIIRCTGCIIYARLLSRESKDMLDHCQPNHGCLSVSSVSAILSRTTWSNVTVHGH